MLSPLYPAFPMMPRPPLSEAERVRLGAQAMSEMLSVFTKMTSSERDRYMAERDRMVIQMFQRLGTCDVHEVHGRLDRDAWHCTRCDREVSGGDVAIVMRRMKQIEAMNAPR